MLIRIILVVGLFLFFIPYANAQQAGKEVYLFFDNIVGIENTVIFNGVENIDLEKTIGDKNKFLNPGREFQLGSITYDNQFFPEIPLKFNVVDDELMVNLSQGGESSVFVLIKEKVQSFSISNKEFQFLSNNSAEEMPAGFYEEIYNSKDFKVFKKYKKVGEKKFDRNYAYFDFKFSSPDYNLNYEDSFYQINSWRDLAEAFPDYKKELKSISKQNKKLEKLDHEAFLKKLFSQMTDLLNQGKF